MPLSISSVKDFTVDSIPEIFCHCYARLMLKTTCEYLTCLIFNSNLIELFHFAPNLPEQIFKRKTKIVCRNFVQIKKSYKINLCNSLTIKSG